MTRYMIEKEAGDLNHFAIDKQGLPLILSFSCFKAKPLGTDRPHY